MILVTGGAGYIGSHTCLELLNAGRDVVVIDNLSNSQFEALNRVQKITGKSLQFIEGDIRCENKISEAFSHPIEAVIHFAGAKSVSESVEKPLKYYSNNVSGTLSVLDAMRKHNCKKIIFSSTATVYGIPQQVPVLESSPLNPLQPYGRSKLMVEEILQDLAKSDPEWRTAILRYFNPVGAHESGKIGEDPHGIPNNLMPYITQVAVGKRPLLTIFGDDYATRDGTGVRDYIHVMDLACGHVKALDALDQGSFTVNLGTGQGYSVLEMLETFIRSTQQAVPYSISTRREGDIAEYWASADKAKELLNWQATRSLEDMCRDAWRWQQLNPNGYQTASSLQK